MQAPHIAALPCLLRMPVMDAGSLSEALENSFADEGI
jgi:hypothetical protein